jgi:hypothetical protein
MCAPRFCRAKTWWQGRNKKRRAIVATPLAKSWNSNDWNFGQPGAAALFRSSGPKPIRRY